VRPELPALEGKEAEIEPCSEGRKVALEGTAEGGGGAVPVGFVGAGHSDVVPGEPVAGVDLDGSLVGVDGLLAPARLVEADPALIPELGRVAVVAHQAVVQLQGRSQLPAEQVNLGHGLQVEPSVLSRLERQPVLPQRLVVIALLPEREAEIEVGEERALDGLRGRGTPALPRLRHPLQG
jgi:hypothetical protein